MSTIKPGIYRRAFDWRLSATDKESMPNVAVALVGLSSETWMDIFEDYLTISRKRIKNRLAMAKLQLHLVEEVMLAQASVKHYRSKWDELKAELAKPQGGNDHTKSDIEAVERELFLYRAYANCFRAIGDGIAWRALGHDRAALRALSGNAVKQQILEQGTINELHQWSSAFDTGQGFAILNALTNWLAIGDITLIKNDGEVEIIEVKSSDADSSRVNRQKQRMREATDLLKNGKGTLEGQDVTIVRFDITPENDLPALFHLLDGAGRSGWAGGRINNCCYIEAFDFRAMGGAEKVWKEGVEQTQKEIASWTENKDLVTRMDSLDILSFTPNCAPFSVFPFPERLCVELLTGAKNYSCFLNLTELGREFERCGWQVEKWPQELLTEGADNSTPFFRLKRDGMHPEIPPADVMRIQMETIRPQVFIRTLDSVFDLGPGGISPSGFAVYEGEKSLWV
jgi:hypothetical protein